LFDIPHLSDTYRASPMYGVCNGAVL